MSSTTLTAIAAVIVSGAAVFVAANQYSVAKAKLKLDLFDKRFDIFQKTWEILSEAASKGTLEKKYGLATPFNNFLPQVRFLFGAAVADYLDVASKKWIDLNSREKGRDGLTGKDGRDNEIEISALQTWFFNEASKGCKVKFGEFLDFENWK